MLGFELDESHSYFRNQDSAPSLILVRELMEAGLLTVPAGQQVLRWLPRLNVTDEEVDEALNIFQKTIQRAAA